MRRLLWGTLERRRETETDSCGPLTLGTVVPLFGALASLPPPPLQYLQPVILLQLEDGQRDLISEWRPWEMMTGNQDKSEWWRTKKKKKKGAAQEPVTREGVISDEEKNPSEV